MAKKRKSYKKKVKRGGGPSSPAADAADRDALSTTKPATTKPATTTPATSATTATATDDKKFLYGIGIVALAVLVVAFIIFITHLEEIGNYFYPREIILKSQYEYAQGDSVTINPTYSNITIIPSNTFTIVPDNGLTVNNDGNITGDIDFKGANEIEFTITVKDHYPSVDGTHINAEVANKKFTIKKKESTPTPTPLDDEDK